MILLEVQLLEEVSIAPWVVIVTTAMTAQLKLLLLQLFFVDYCS